jgi:hypothetical protein
VFEAPTGTVADRSQAVAEAMKNVGALPHVVSATDPLTVSGTPAVPQDGRIAYGSVSWDRCTRRSSCIRKINSSSRADCSAFS